MSQTKDVSDFAGWIINTIEGLRKKYNTPPYNEFKSGAMEVIRKISIELEELEFNSSNEATKLQKGKCVMCGEPTDSATSALDINYCGPCWNKGKRINEEILPTTKIISYIGVCTIRNYNEKYFWDIYEPRPEQVWPLDKVYYSSGKESIGGMNPDVFCVRVEGNSKEECEYKIRLLINDKVREVLNGR